MLSIKKKKKIRKLTENTLQIIILLKIGDIFKNYWNNLIVKNHKLREEKETKSS